jgi:hypothetical protein
MISESMQRPLPSFDKWLTDHGHGERGDGFDALVDLARRTQEQKSPNMTPDELSFLRMWQGMLIAVVEICNIEHNSGRKPEEIICTMPRVLASAAMYATASVLASDADWRTSSRACSADEFRAAAKIAADQLLSDSREH